MDHPYSSLPCNVDESLLKERLEAAYSNINFLQQEHATTIKGLHEEIEKLQNMHRDLEFHLEVQNEQDRKDAKWHSAVVDLEETIEVLKKENEALKRKLYDSSHTIAILDQKQKLLKWQHHQELEERELTIMRLQKELETKCSTLAQLTSHLQRKKRASFLRRFSFNSESPGPNITRVNKDHSSKDFDQQAKSLPFYQSDFCLHHGNSPNSSFSDRSASDDDSMSRRSIKNEEMTHTRERYSSYESTEKESSELKLPPIIFPAAAVSQRQLVRQQIRVDKLASKNTPDTLAIDQISSPELVTKRLNKAL